MTRTANEFYGIIGRQDFTRNFLFMNPFTISLPGTLIPDELEEEEADQKKTDTEKDQILCPQSRGQEIREITAADTTGYCPCSDKSEQAFRLTGIEDIVCQQPELWGGDHSENGYPNIQYVIKPATLQVKIEEKPEQEVVDELKSRQDVDLLKVTLDNRNQLALKIIDKISI